MAEMWHYTREGKQMEPVPIGDLKRLLGEGVVKPTDMVWRDGMPRWTRASAVKDLYPSSSSRDAYFSGPTVVPVDDGPGARLPGENGDSRSRRRPRRSNDGEDSDHDSLRRRRPAATSGGYGTQILIACLVGGFVLLGSLVVGILIIAAPQKQQRVQVEIAVPMEVKEDELPVAPAPVQKADPAVVEDIKIGTGVLPIAVSLAPGAEHFLKFRVKANHAASITVTPLPAPGKVLNLDMQAFKASDNTLIAADVTPNASASVVFTLPTTEIVRVRVHNASKKTTVTQFTIVYNVGN